MNELIQYSYNPTKKNTSSVATINEIQSSVNFQNRNGNKKLYSSGAYYIGNLKGNRRNGWGKFKWSTGCEHEGYYVDNKRDGKGTFSWMDGSTYKGEFKNDLRHGYGEINWLNGESFVGNFENDQRNGYGVYVWPEIGKYEGNFKANLKEGYGVFTMNNGDKFEGIYKEDQRWGPGIFTYVSTGEQDIGIWKGKCLLRICTIIEDAFMFEHLVHHKINCGEQVSKQIRLSNSAKVNVPNTPELFLRSHRIFENAELPSIPIDFPYQNIIDGIRKVHSSKGPIEISSEFLLEAAKNGDIETVQNILEEGNVNANVSDKTGFSALMAASVNCHVDVINVLLDHGANINQVTDEGLSVLLACHILLYTKENFIENIAEAMPKDNLFNSVDIDKKTGNVINRIERKMIMAIFEDIHQPFNNLKKSKITSAFVKQHPLKKKALVCLQSRDSRITSRPVSPNTKSALSNENRESRVDIWKLEYYQHSMDHVREVEKINNSFKEIMLANPHKYIKGSSSGISDRVYCSDSTFDSDNSDESINDESTANVSAIDEQASEDLTVALSTTAASIYGYDPATEVQSMTVSEHKLLDDELILRLINKERTPHLQNTIKLLLKRGANPNCSSLPMSALFFAVKAADPAAVLALLKQSADTSSRLKDSNLCPLHIAVALPCVEGIEITRLLLQYGANPNLRDTFPNNDVNSGRTPLHIVCSREDNFKQCQKITRLLLEYNADPNLLCVGNAPLSLAIASGNDMIVDTLLKYRANPSLKLTHGLGSIMCVAVSFQAERRRTPHERMKLIEKLIKNGADMLTPVRISDKYPPGTVVDYGYHVFLQDRRIACTPYHALSSIEREVYNARRGMLDTIGNHLRTAARLKEEQASKSGNEDEDGNIERDEFCGLRFVSIKNGSKSQSDFNSFANSNISMIKRMRYCYECGRSIGVRLSPCSRCREVFYCSKGCKVKAWNIRHRDECAKYSGMKTSSSHSRNDSPTPTSEVNAKHNNNVIRTSPQHASKQSKGFLPRIK